MIVFRAPTDPTVLAELRTIPGVRVGQKVVRCTPDVASAVARILNESHPGLGIVPRQQTESLASCEGWENLFPWQREGADALAGSSKRGLYWPTGSGKTCAGLAAIERSGAKRVLVVTRAIGRDAWARDTTRVGHRRVALLLGRASSLHSTKEVKRADKHLDSLRSRGSDCFATDSVSAALAKGAAIVVVGWEILEARIEEIAAENWDVVIFDEHHLGKGRLAGRTLAAHKLISGGTKVWSMTATPVRDRLRDLWAQLYCIAPDAWNGSSWRFVHRYCLATPGRYGGLDTTGVSNVAELRERIEYWFDIRDRSEIAGQLPAKRRLVTRIPSDAAAKAASAGRGLRGLESAIAVSAEAKRPYVVDRAAEVLLGGGKVIVVGNRLAWVPRMITAIEKACESVRPVRDRLWIRPATGEVNASERQALAREYMERPDTACLVATIDAISESMDLQDTDAMILAALPFTPGQVTQVEGRVSRLGQKRPVLIEYVVAEGSVDEQIESLILVKLAAVEESGAKTESIGIGSWGPSEEEIVSRLKSWLEAGVKQSREEVA